MATVTAGKTFISGETVTPAKLNSLGLPTVAIADDEVITSKIINAAVTADKLASGAVTGAAGGGKLAASVITDQTTIADPLADTDTFLVHDDSASALRKVAYSNIAPTVTASKLNGVVKDSSGNNLSAGDPPLFGCRAFVNFNGTRNATDTGASVNGGTVRIRSSGNVASVTKNAAGDYTVAFTTAMPDVNYAVVFGAGLTGGSASGQMAACSIRDGTPLSTGSVRLTVNYANGTSNQADAQTVTVAVFR